jgi:molybdate transport system regulatory protein
MKKKYYVDGHISLKSVNSTFIGSGKIELIEKVKELGSLSKAATEMNISYRQAWKKIQELNNFASTPLVTLKRGGLVGGYAVVTKFGDKVILNYRNLRIAFDDFLMEQTKKLDF